MIFPIILIIFLSNGGKAMADATTGVRDIMNSVNRSVNTVIDSEVSLQTALNVIGGTSAARAVIGLGYRGCQSTVDIPKFNACVTAASAGVNLSVALIKKNWPSGGGTQMRAAIKKWDQDLDERNKGLAAVKTPEEAQKAASNAQNIDITKAGYDGTSLNSVAQELERVLLGFRSSFLYIIEIMILITGLLGPVFMGLSMFPVGTKPLIAWGTSFLSLGFCKICFSLISGLSAVAMVFAGPKNVDMLTASILLGLLAPVLSFSIASGSGIQALSTISYSTQGFGFGTGITPYNPQTIQQEEQQRNNNNSQKNGEPEIF
jgi:hypothetical protein